MCLLKYIFIEKETPILNFDVLYSIYFFRLFSKYLNAIDVDSSNKNRML